jgi:hypothetical protein
MALKDSAAYRAGLSEGSKTELKCVDAKEKYGLGDATTWAGRS